MYHFAWVDQKEKQGYKCDVSLKGGNLVAKCFLTRSPLLIVGLHLLIILSLYI